MSTAEYIVDLYPDRISLDQADLIASSIEIDPSTLQKTGISYPSSYLTFLGKYIYALIPENPPRIEKYEKADSTFTKLITMKGGDNTAPRAIKAMNGYVYYSWTPRATGGGGLAKLDANLVQVGNTDTVPAILAAGPDKYLYAAGGSMIYKIDTTTMETIATITFNGEISALVAAPDGYIYCAGRTGVIWKIDTVNLVSRLFEPIKLMQQVGESENYGSAIAALAIIGGYIYCGGAPNISEWTKIWKFDRASLVKVGESPDLGPAARITAIQPLGPYIYTGIVAGTVYTAGVVAVLDQNLSAVLGKLQVIPAYHGLYAFPLYARLKQ